jgi:hypothetical protein
MAWRFANSAHYLKIADALIHQALNQSLSRSPRCHASSIKIHLVYSAPALF